MNEPQDTRHWADEESADRPAVPGYDILGVVGRGGMGVVYKARQTDPARLVALKVIRDGALAGPQALARFRIEAEAAARMDHPNIVRIHEVGEHAGRPYLAMELVEGDSLDRHLAGRPHPPEQAAALIRSLALALAHAHERKIVHRDVKPANILLQNAECGIRNAEFEPDRNSSGLHSTFRIPNSTFIPKLTDFGLAKRLDAESTAWTQDGAVLGTPGYMAPEQAAGRVQEVGPHTDVYGLGAVLYELLTGHPPFQGDTWNHTLQRVIHDDPDPPSRAEPSVPRDLETVCLKCLEKEPGRRYASAQELADDLGRFLDRAPVAAVPPSAAERLTRAAARDGYRDAAEVRRGPRSAVYRATHGPLDQQVAVKVFPPGTHTPAGWEDHLRRGAELRAVAAHPHVLAVLRTAWWDGCPCVVTEYAPHGTLADHPAGPRRSIRETLELVARLAELVGYFHRQGVVHGNLKPGNVLLAADGIPRVTDFRLTGGLFQGPLPAGGADPAAVAYLAPELVNDPTAEARPHTDVYGLGLVLYERLTGRPPFAGSTAAEVLEQVQSADPERPSAFHADVTPALDAVCLRCLRKDPWRRYPRAYDLLTRLRHLIDDPTGRNRPGRR